jgi:intein-encoded DNA endonuclease-like protein
MFKAFAVAFAILAASEGLRWVLVTNRFKAYEEWVGPVNASSMEDWLEKRRARDKEIAEKYPSRYYVKPWG